MQLDGLPDMAVRKETEMTRTELSKSCENYYECNSDCENCNVYKQYLKGK